MVNKLVSVIMPVYNGEKTIKLAINSLLHQSYKNWICIIVNDGSTDGTANILNTITDKRFKIIHLKKNVGRGAARQICLDNAEGDYLTYLDADDFYHENKLLHSVEELEKNPSIVLVASKVATYDKKLNLTTIRGKKGMYNFSLGDPLFFMPVSSMIRLDFARLVKYNPSLNASEDVDYFNNYLASKSYSVINEVLYFYNAFESATYSKVLEYSFSELRRILSMRCRIPIKVLKQAPVITVKYLIYAIGIPFLGVDFFMNRRGTKPSESEKNEMRTQLKNLSISIV